MHSLFQHDTSLSPSDLVHLEQIFDTLCEQEHLSRRSAAADDIAKRVLQIHKAGVRDPAIFITAVRYRAKRMH